MTSLADELLNGIPELLPRVLLRLVDTLPAYGELPIEELAGDVRQITERNLRGFASTLAAGGQPPADLLDRARESAVRRGEEGIPLEVILTAYLVGIHEGIDYLRPHMDALDTDAMLDLMRTALGFQHLLLQAVSSGYLEQRESLVGETQAAQGALLTALVDGSDPTEAARAAGHTLPAAYLVVALVLGTHPDESAAGVNHAVAARRKVRRVKVELAAVGGNVLSALSPDGGLALIPARDNLATPARLQERLQAAAGADVTLAHSLAAPADVPGAVRLAYEVLEVVRATDRPPGGYQLADVLLDYQLTRPGPARDHLGALLDPVAARPALLHTLQTYLAKARRRRVTAQALNVHPNTIDNRLQRVRDLIGLDATDAEDVQVLRAALAARAMGSRV